VGFIIFTVAIVMAVLLILARAIPSLESTLYGFIKYNYPRLYSLSCPVLMTPLDQQPVTIRLHNSLDRNLKWFVEAQFSTPALMDTSDQTLELQPGETRKLVWQVDKHNIDLGNFIFARVFTSAATASGMQEATCGIFVLNLPFSGGPVIYYATLALTVVAAGLGFLLWKRNTELSDPGASSLLWWMSFMCLVIAIGLICALLGFWFVALVMVLLTLLTTGVYLIPRKV
jgi:hypothetical protein